MQQSIQKFFITTHNTVQLLQTPSNCPLTLSVLVELFHGSTFIHLYTEEIIKYWIQLEFWLCFELAKLFIAHEHLHANIQEYLLKLLV